MRRCHYVLIAALAGAAGLSHASPQPDELLQRQQEAEHHARCDRLRHSDAAQASGSYTEEGRRCLLQALMAARTLEGVLGLARDAAAALRRTPDDEALRGTALAALERARDRLAGQRDALPSPAAATTQAVWQQLAAQATALDLAEFALRLPQVHHHQQLWRLQALRIPGR